jgi:hypothetical protein
VPYLSLYNGGSPSAPKPATVIQLVCGLWKCVGDAEAAVLHECADTARIGFENADAAT